MSFFHYLLFPLPQLKEGGDLTSTIASKNWVPWFPKPTICECILLNLNFSVIKVCDWNWLGVLTSRNVVFVLYCIHSDVRWNKGTILRASVEYIKQMQKDIQRTRAVENNFKKMEMTNKQLLLRIQVTHTNMLTHTHTCCERFSHQTLTDFVNCL